MQKKKNNNFPSSDTAIKVIETPYRLNERSEVIVEVGKCEC